MIRIASVTALAATIIMLVRNTEMTHAICNIVREQIPGGDLAAWYNPCSQSTLRPINDERKLSTWSTGFAQKALWAECSKRIPYDLTTIPVREEIYPSEDQETYVGWDQGKVVDLALEKPLYSTEFGPCIAVLARGYRKNSDLPTHLALHHVFMNPSKLTDTLHQLAEEMGTGKIEIFISGGMKMTEGNREAIYKIIQESQTKSSPIKVLDDTFGIADLGTAYKCSDQCYPMTTGIAYTGFTTVYQNPLQIIKVEDRYREIPDSDIKKILWFPG